MRTHRAAYCASSTAAGLALSDRRGRHSGAMAAASRRKFMVATDAARGRRFLPRDRLCGESREGGLQGPAARRSRPAGRLGARGSSVTPNQNTKTDQSPPAFPRRARDVVDQDPGRRRRRKPSVVLLRGDHQLSETKFQNRDRLPGVPSSPRRGDPRLSLRRRRRLARSRGLTGLPVLRDECLRPRATLICGANKNDYHLRHVTPGEDFQASITTCARCPR